VGLSALGSSNTLQGLLATLTKVDDVDVAAAVVLDELVGAMVSAAANDVGNAAALDGDGVLAHILEPDVFEVASAEAVDAFLLVGTDDNIAERSALLENEDGIRVALMEI
jgi:hypothetical protein